MLISHFGGPPYAYLDNVVKACVAGLLRGKRVRIQPEGMAEITDIRDAGVREAFDKDRAFGRAVIVAAGEDEIGANARNRICRFFEDHLGIKLDHEDHAIADAVSNHFPAAATRLRDVFGRLGKLPGRPEAPDALVKLEDALEACVAKCRETKPTVERVKKYLNVLNDGFKKLHLYDSELTATAIEQVSAAAEVRDHHAAQLREVGALDPEREESARRVREHLERPWNDIAVLDGDFQTIRGAYHAERSKILAWQERETEQRRATLKRRPGFSTLTSDQSAAVLRPFAEAESSTSADALHPTLFALHDPFVVALGRADERANDLLDEILSEGPDQLVERVDLGLRNREVATEDDVKRLLAEIEERLLPKVKGGVRVRLT